MRVSSEGNDKARAPEDELPIDINYVKFTDWLLDRQKVKPNWRDSLRNIQQKVWSNRMKVENEIASQRAQFNFAAVFIFGSVKTLKYAWLGL